MKFTVLGGGGIRAPFLAKSIVGAAKELDITEVTFMDVSREKLEIYGALSAGVAKAIDASVAFTTTTDPVEALRGADCVIAALRVGGDEGRVKDEKIALELGVLGQETTGAGGFAMAMRSIPVLSGYMELVKKHANPGCRVFNFTNPSGLVTQALIRQGYDVTGICDNPYKQKEEFAKVLGVDESRVSAECFGLNHLSWFRSLRVDGVEKIKELLDDPRLYAETEMHFFDPEFARWLGLLFNGYLYYYYSREEAVRNILKSGTTRGETILAINRRMNEDLSAMDIRRDFERAGLAYLSFLLERENSYMAIESGFRLRHRVYDLDKLVRPAKAEGYAGVALGIVKALRGGADRYLEMITVNDGALPFLADDDTVEVTCAVGPDGIRPLRFDGIPMHPRTLIAQMKAYENMAVDAILARDKMQATAALMTNPLVNSWTLAKKLLDGYLGAHGEVLPDWR